jgi:hypothetical protein
METVKNNKNIRPIAGFKVMHWIKAVREKEYELYKKDPQEYFIQLKNAGKRMRERLH